MISTTSQNLIQERQNQQKLRQQPSWKPTGIAAGTKRRARTSLNVWWFGGQESEYSNDDEECELVAVKIERPTSNSRRIMGEISVPASVDDVWAILTDYDRLSIHVPNLVESRRLSNWQSNMGGGEQGDGQYKCRLYQKGAQKIIGFEFGASVTMDMTESTLSAVNINKLPQASTRKDFDLVDINNDGDQERQLLERKIDFKCVESQFFSAFDGSWRVKSDDITGETVVYYDVLVKPNGPVPVAALEWRIREDVPTNLRAVKKAAIEVGYDGVMATRQPKSGKQFASTLATVKTAVDRTRNDIQRNTRAVRNAVGSATSAARQSVASASSSNRNRLTPIPVTAQTEAPQAVETTDWNDDETMAVYL